MDFFVYGTLMPGEVNHDALLAGKTSREVPATLAGARMWANGDRFALPGRSWAFPFVALDEDPSATVTGCLVSIAPEHQDDVLRELDELETYSPGAADNRYERVRVTADVVGNDTEPERVECWTYVAAERIRPELTGLPVVPDGDWLRYLGKS